MNLLQKIATAFRGAGRETLEQVVDANGLRIFEQEIHDCQHAITTAKRQLSNVLAERMRLQRDITEVESAIAGAEGRLADAIAADDAERMRCDAEWIADKEQFKRKQSDKLSRIREHEARLKKGLKAAVRQVEDYQLELRAMKTTESARRATLETSGHISLIDNRLSRTMESLDRIKSRQQAFADSMEAMVEVDEVLSRDQEMHRKQQQSAASAVLDRVRRGMEDAGNRQAAGAEAVRE